ncbi:MAG: DedA family protein [Caldibacillus sp.]
MENWILQLMEQFGYFGVFFLILVENIFPPIPSEVILTFGGFMTSRTSLTLLGVIFFATLGSLLGAIVLYWIGRLLDIERMEKIVERWGHILRLKKEDIHKANQWFDRYGIWTVFFCRMVPVLRSLISIPAGMNHMDMGVFLFFTTIGTLIWNTILVGLGAYLGESWEIIVYYMDIYSNIVYALLVILFIIGMVYFFHFKRKRT